MTQTQRLIQKLQELYTPPDQPGSLQLHVRGHDALNCFFQLGNQLDAVQAEVREADAHLHVTISALNYILEREDVLDLRVPPLVQAVSSTGRESLVQHFEQLLKRPSQRVQAVVTALARNPVAACSSIMETDGADVQTALAAMLDSRPVCFRKAIGSEVTQWGLDDLAERFGSVPLRKSPTTGKVETFGEFVAACRSSGAGRVYTNGCAVPAAFDALLEFPFFRPQDYSASRLWFGRKCDRLITRLHRDFANSFLGHIWGTKRMYLYHPDQIDFLYMVPSHNNYQISRIDPLEPDYERFPLLAHAKPLVIDLEPGDLLIIPTGWFHCVAAPTDVLSVSRFLENDDVQRLARASMTPAQVPLQDHASPALAL